MHDQDQIRIFSGLAFCALAAFAGAAAAKEPPVTIWLVGDSRLVSYDVAENVSFETRMAAALNP